MNIQSFDSTVCNGYTYHSIFCIQQNKQNDSTSDRSFLGYPSEASYKGLKGTTLDKTRAKSRNEEGESSPTDIYEQLTKK